MTTSIKINRNYPHPIENVWRAITTPELLEQWLMPNDFQPVVGHKFTFRTDPAPGFDGIVHCEVLELQEPTLLKFSWKGGPIDTVVTFQLAEADGKTKLSMQQTGFVGLKGWLVGQMLRLGFRKMSRKLLPAVLQQMDGGSAERSPQESVECRGSSKRAFEFIFRILPKREQ